MTPGYIVLRSFITDPQAFAQRRHIFAKLIQNSGGRFLVRSDRFEVLAGGVSGFLLTVVAYPSLAAMEVILSSPEREALEEDVRGKASLDIWSVSGLEAPATAPPHTPPPSAEPRGYLLARASVPSLRRPDADRDPIEDALGAEGGRVLIRTNQVRLVAGPTEVPRLTLIEFPSLPKLRAALPSSDAASTRALWQNLGVLDLWLAPGV